MGYRGYSVARGHIVDANGSGDFKTIGAALTAASSGETIFIRPGTYTENITLVAGVNLTAMRGDVFNVIIKGKCSYSAAGAVHLTNIQLQTNSDYCLEVTGSSASVVSIKNCYINALNNTGIHFSSSSGSSAISISYSRLTLGTTGIAAWTSSSAGGISITYTNIGNPGGSSTVSSNSAGTVGLSYCLVSIPISCSSTGLINVVWSSIDSSAVNTASLATAGSATSLVYFSRFSSGTASSMSIGSGTTVQTDIVNINSSNANALAGSGTIQYGLITYQGSSSTNGVGTQTHETTQPTT